MQHLIKRHFQIHEKKKKKKTKKLNQKAEIKIHKSRKFDQLPTWRFKEANLELPFKFLKFQTSFLKSKGSIRIKIENPNHEAYQYSYSRMNSSSQLAFNDQKQQYAIKLPTKKEKQKIYTEREMNALPAVSSAIQRTVRPSVRLT